MGCVSCKSLIRANTSIKGTIERAPPSSNDDYVSEDDLSETEEHVDIEDWPAAEDINSVPYKGEVVKAKVVSVYDGDTCTILIPYGSSFMKYNLRIIGVDAPEIRARRDKKKDGERSPEEIQQLDELVTLERRAAINVRDIVKEMICDKEVNVVIERHDKYGGRLLGTIHLPKGYGEKTLKDYLLQHRMAKEYYGKAKEPWVREELLHLVE